MPEPLPCPHCGAPCEEMQRFCDNCGFCLADPTFRDPFADVPRAGKRKYIQETPAAPAPLTAQEPAVQMTAAKPPAEKSAGTKKRRHRSMRIVGVAALTGCFAAGLVFIWYQKHQQTKPHGKEYVFYLDGDALMLSLPQKEPICISAHPDTDHTDFNAEEFYQKTVKLTKDGSRVFFIRSLYDTKSVLSYIDLSAPEIVHDAATICVSNLIRIFNSWNLIYCSDPEDDLIEPLNPAFVLMDRHGDSVVFRDENNILCAWDGKTGEVNIVDKDSQYDALGYWTSPQPDSDSDMLYSICYGLSKEKNSHPMEDLEFCFYITGYPSVDGAERETIADDIVMWEKPASDSPCLILFKESSETYQLQPSVFYFGNNVHPGVTSSPLPYYVSAYNDFAFQYYSSSDMHTRQYSVFYGFEDGNVFSVGTSNITIEHTDNSVIASINPISDLTREKAYSAEQFYPDGSVLVSPDNEEASYFWLQKEQSREMVEINQQICALSEQTPSALVWNADSLQYQFITQNGNCVDIPELCGCNQAWLSGDGKRFAVDSNRFLTGTISEDGSVELNEISGMNGVENVWFLGTSDLVYAAKKGIYYRNTRIASYDAEKAQAECTPDGSALYFYTDVTGEADTSQRGTLHRFSDGTDIQIAEQAAGRIITADGVYFIAPDGETDALWFCGADNIAQNLGKADTLLFTLNDDAAGMPPQ